MDAAPLRDTPPVVAADMRRFLTEVRAETIDLKTLGIARISLDEVLAQLGRIYVIQDQDGGFVAECLSESIVTEADTWQELRANVKSTKESLFQTTRASGRVL